MNDNPQELNNTGLVIGPGFQLWIDAHNGTPKSDELYFSQEMSCMMVQVAEGNVLLFYNKPTNEISAFMSGKI